MARLEILLRSRHTVPAAIAIVGVFTLFGFTSLSQARGEPPQVSGAAVVRRLQPAQYQNVIADVFGSDVIATGNFEPPIRRDGLLALGAASASITATGLKQYDAMAQSIARQVVDPQHRAALVPCSPAYPTMRDDKCAAGFLDAVGTLLFRRPLTAAQLSGYVKVAGNAADTLQDFYRGLERSLNLMLVSPDFLFIKDVVEPDPKKRGAFRLDSYSLASRLSFLFWNTSPDNQLLEAAGKGWLQTPRGLAREVDRLIASPRLADGVRAFFSDMYGFEEFDTLAKDTSIYPKFAAKLVEDAKEQTLRTIVDHVVTRNGDYRDLFTTRRTFLTPQLAALYQVTVNPNPANDFANGVPAQWVAYEYPEGDPRVGLFTQAGFAALHSHPGRSSPTLRGKAIRELFLCQKVPPPPPNVDFAVVQDTNNPVFRTARDRVQAHLGSPVCAGCHKITDPIGLALENFDSDGAFRTTENRVKIDTSGELNGVQFADAAGLARAIHDSPALTSCVVSRLYSFAIGKTADAGDTALIRRFQSDFAAQGHRLPDLMRLIALDEAFQRVPLATTGDESMKK